MTANSIWATFSINGLFFVIIIFLFERYRVRVLDLYAPNSRGNNPKFALPRAGYFQWIRQLHDIPDEQMFAIAGMDGYMFLRFILFCCKLVTICSVPCALVLIPVYATSPSSRFVNGFEMASMANINHNGHRLWAPFVFAYLFTFVFLYLIHKEYENFIVMRKKYFHGAHDIVPLQTKYTVQVENIPDEYRNSEKLFEVFESLFPGDVLYAHVIVDTPELDKLVAERDSVRDQLEKEIAIFEGNGRKNRPLLDMAKLSPRRYSSGHEVDSITYLTRRLHKLCSRTARLQRAIIEDQREPEGMPESPRPVLPAMDNILDIADPKDLRSSPTGSEDSDESDDEGDADGIEGIEMNPVYNPLTSASAPPSPRRPRRLSDVLMPPSPKKTRKFSDVLMDVRNRISEHFNSTTGFVTFKTRRATITAVKTTILLEQYPYMTAAQAPPPVDVIWENLSASTMVTEETAFFSAGIYYGSLAFWGGVMAFVAAISTASSLQHYVPFLRRLDYIAYSIVEGILPVVVVLAFSGLVSGAIAFVAQRVEQRKTNSAVEREVFRWYFKYQLANIYLILVAGSVWESLRIAVQRPEAIVMYISAALPKVSSFFINYILTIWLSGVPYKLIRRFRALEYLIYRCSTFPRYMTRRSMKNGPFRDTRVQYGTELSDVLYVLCVVLLYWVISPVVVLFALPLFWSWFYMWKYQFVFVVTRTYESGGDLWFRMYQYSMAGLLVGTIIFMAYMGIKEGKAQGPLLFPLPVIILIAWKHTESCFRVQSKHMPFDLTIKDDSQRQASQEQITARFCENFMKPPNLVGPAEIFPYPYRIGEVPLFDEYGSLNAEYVDDLPAPVDVSGTDDTSAV